MIGQYILKDGQPVPIEDPIKWAEWFGQDNRRVARDTINGVVISTVFLGLDHNFGEGPPILWETMIFNGPLDQAMWRYTSVEDALTNHQRVTRRLSLKTRKKRKQWDFHLPLKGGPARCFYHSGEE